MLKIIISAALALFIGIGIGFSFKSSDALIQTQKRLAEATNSLTVAEKHLERCRAIANQLKSAESLCGDAKKKAEKIIDIGKDIFK